MHMWRPGGNLPPVEIQYDLMRSLVEAQLTKRRFWHGLWASVWLEHVNWHSHLAGERDP